MNSTDKNNITLLVVCVMLMISFSRNVVQSFNVNQLVDIIKLEDKYINKTAEEHYDVVRRLNKQLLEKCPATATTNEE